MSKKSLKALVWKEGSWFVARAVGIEVASQGRTKKDAIKNLAEAVDLLLENEDLDTSSIMIPDDPELTAVYA